MAVYGVQVGVALSRPPQLDEYWWIVVESSSSLVASLIALQIAASHKKVVMPVWCGPPVRLELAGPSSEIKKVGWWKWQRLKSLISPPYRIPLPLDNSTSSSVNEMDT